MRPQRESYRAFRRWAGDAGGRCLHLILALWLLVAAPLATADEIVAARVWPAREYTRVTLESRTPIQFEMSMVPDPARVVVDLNGITPTEALNGLPRHIGASDPFVAQVRIGRFKPHVTRVVFDLKQTVNPHAFVIEPVGEYRYRLVVDLYPTKTIDPLVALLDEIERRPPPPASPGQTAPSPKSRKPAAAEAARTVVVAIDPGHGGEDPGAVGAQGSHEKDITLALALKLKAKMDAEPQMHGALIRDGDYFVALHQRVERARQLRADLLISLHADAFIRADARGASVFALSEKGATSAAARWLAKRENAADLIGGVDLSGADAGVKQVLFDLSQTATLNSSLRLARMVLKEIGGINALHKPHVEQAGFAVLKAPDIPSILV
ncbi:MAG: AMIN domain-containing protein, partial [Betaproteobacteria bacterium]|nr:AMIN domain-containing protein [Betaproteobacteria bacterium]